jgi:hypothetical protein
MLSAPEAEFDVCAHGGKKLARSFDVTNLRDIFENDRLIGKQGSGHAGKSGVLRATDTDGAEQRLAAADD